MLIIPSFILHPSVPKLYEITCLWPFPAPSPPHFRSVWNNGAQSVLSAAVVIKPDSLGTWLTCPNL